MLGFFDRARSAAISQVAMDTVLPSALEDGVGTSEDPRFRGSIARPARTPVNASLPPLPTDSHDSGADVACCAFIARLLHP
jgi:hypothetical protein